MAGAIESETNSSPILGVYQTDYELVKNILRIARNASAGLSLE
jgi:hypothetical protein